MTTYTSKATSQFSQPLSCVTEALAVSSRGNEGPYEGLKTVATGPFTTLLETAAGRDMLLSLLAKLSLNSNAVVELHMAGIIARRNFQAGSMGGEVKLLSAYCNSYIVDACTYLAAKAFPTEQDIQVARGAVDNALRFRPGCDLALWLREVLNLPAGQVVALFRDTFAPDRSL